MDLLKLKYFYVVAQNEHVTKSAEKLHVAQPAVTKSIRLLEEELKVPLFYRVGRNVKLTEYGKLLKSRLDNVFPVIDKIEEEITTLKKENQNVIKLNVLAASIAVIEAVVKYKNKYPEVVFNIIQHEQTADCDISVTATVDDNILNKPFRQVVKTKKIEEKILIATSKKSKYEGLKSIELKSLCREKFIFIAGSRPFKYICEKFCKQAGFQPSIGFESDSPIAVKNIISADAGVGFWPEFSWGKIKTKEVEFIPVSDVECKREIVVELYDNPLNSNHTKNFFEYLTTQLLKMQKS